MAITPTTDLSADEVVYRLAWGDHPGVEWVGEFYRRQIPVERATRLAALVNPLLSQACDLFPFADLPETLGIDLVVAGVEPGDDLAGYFGGGIDDPADILTLARAGVSGEDVTRYRWAGVAAVNEMLALASAGVTGVDAGLYDPASATEMVTLAQARISGEDASRYWQAGVESTHTMLALLEAGVTPNRALAYAGQGVDADQMAPLSILGVSAADVDDWARVGVGADEIANRIADGSTPETVRIDYDQPWRR